MSIINALLNEMAAERQALQQLMFANTPFAGAGMRMPPFPSMRMPSFDAPPPSSPGAPSPPSIFNMWPSMASLNSLPSSIGKITPQQPMELVNHNIINEKDGKLTGESKEWVSPPDPNRRSRAKMTNVQYNDDNVKAHVQSYSSATAYNSGGFDPNTSTDDILPQMPRTNIKIIPGSFAYTGPRFRY